MYVHWRVIHIGPLLRTLLTFTRSDLLHVRYGYEETKAAWLSSFSQIVPIFLSPFLGAFLDHYGKRSYICTPFLSRSLPYLC